MAIPVTKRFTLLIGGVDTCYIDIHYIKSHPNPDPDTFEIRTLPECAEGVSYFDTVDIRKDGVTEYYGFVEEITPEVGEDGLEYLLTGRCWKLFTWKKWNERYQESREIGPTDSENNIESGFFGNVKPEELIKFILRCPKSIHPKDKIRHKIGWGIPSQFWDACANITADCHYPQWVFLRYTGLAWRGRGGSEDMVWDKLVVNNFDSTYTQWYTTGVQPWLDNDDADTNKVWLSRPPAGQGIYKVGHFEFANIGGTRDFIYGVRLYIKYRGIADRFAYRSWCKVHLYDGTTWHHIGWLTTSYSWTYISFNVMSILDTIAKINAAEIYFEYQLIGLFDGIHITYAYLDVEASTLATDYQHIDDWFVVDLGSSYDDVTAMLIECRNNPTTYPRNYKIQYASVSNCCDGDDPPLESEWNEFTPAINEVNNNARDILHSWEAEDDVQCIRIKLTADHTDNPWEISQIYVWQADEHKYRLMDEGD